MSAADSRVSDLLRSARKQIQKGEREKALGILRKALDIDPDNSEVREEIDSVEREIAAMSAFKRTRSTRSHTPDSSVSSPSDFVDECVERSQQALDQGDEVRALQELERARRHDPENRQVQKRILAVKRTIKTNNLADLAFTKLKQDDPAAAVEQAREIFDLWSEAPVLERLLGEIEAYGTSAPVEEGLEDVEVLEEAEIEDLESLDELEEMVEEPESRPEPKPEPEPEPAPEPEPEPEPAPEPEPEPSKASGAEAVITSIREKIARSAYEEAMLQTESALHDHPDHPTLLELHTKLKKVAGAAKQKAAPAGAPRPSPAPVERREKKKSIVPIIIGVAAVVVVVAVLFITGIIGGGGGEPSEPVPTEPVVQPYSVAVAVEGASNATVSLDGQPLQQGESGIYSTSGEDFGQKILEVRADSFQTVRRSVDLQNGQALRDTITMRPLGSDSAYIALEVMVPEGDQQPEADEVTYMLNGEEIQGQGVSVPTGRHVLQAMMEGYNSTPETLLVDSPDTLSRQLALLAPDQGQISLSLAAGVPGNAIFYVDGERITTGRAMSHVTDFGTHTVLVRQEGFEDWIASVDLADGGYSRTVTLEETQTTGTLRISPEPPATVYINGENRGQTPLPPIELEEGEYTVRLTNPDYEEQVSTVSIAAGEDTRIQYTAQQLAAEDEGGEEEGGEEEGGEEEGGDQEVAEDAPISPPFPISQIAPVTPSLANQRGDVHGYVTLEVSVAADGSVSGVTVVNDEVGLGCGNAAREAVSQWQFNPAMQGGQPVPSTTTVQVRFDVE